MISSKHISKFITALMVTAVCLCLVLTAFGDKLTALVGGSGVTMEYESKLFDTSKIISVNIKMDEDDWNEMLENAISEEYYQCDVEINGTTFRNVAIRPKGNTSLSSIADDPDTDRYSFKLEFDYYVDGQTCYGLDKLILNNNYADATNMKEALVYDMFQSIGADASLYNYAQISVNGEYWGVYLALEAVEDSFLMRNYGAQNGDLYKPEGSMGGFGGSSGNGGADLNYSDDELSSYETIWDGEVTDSGKSDHKRVVTALKNISEGNDLEAYMDVDNILRYMAVHVFSVNEDSLSGFMAHNYYLYESGGQLNIIPWDYNLAFGGMSMGGGPGSSSGSGATSTINSAIDDSWSSTNFMDGLLENEAYLSQYHSYLQQLVTDYVEGGGLDAFYERVRSQIDSLVETDPTAFYSYSEYETAAETLYQVVKLRAESIQGQLGGSIPSTSDAQRTASDSMVDGSSIDLSVMGTMNNGGGGKGGPGEDAEPGHSKDAQTDDSAGQDDAAFIQLAASTDSDTDAQQAPDQKPDTDRANADSDTDSSQDETAASADTEGSDSRDFPDGFDPSDFDGNFPGGDFPDDGNFGGGGGNHGGPGGNFPGGENADSSASNLTQNLILYGISGAILIAALLFARFYRRRPKKR